MMGNNENIRVKNWRFLNLCFVYREALSFDFSRDNLRATRENLITKQLIVYLVLSKDWNFKIEKKGVEISLDV